MSQRHAQIDLVLEMPFFCSKIEKSEKYDKRKRMSSKHSTLDAGRILVVPSRAVSCPDKRKLEDWQNEIVMHMLKLKTEYGIIFA